MDSLGDRMKNYERVSNYILTPKSCVIIRVDGKAFHTYCRNFDKPFDEELIMAMKMAAGSTSDNIQGCKIFYTQSDECSFLITDFDKHESQGWFNYEVQKIVSVSASLFTGFFNNYMKSKSKTHETAFFDSRAFIVPKDDVINYFLWRAKDWERNSLQMYARAFFSHKQLFGKKKEDIHEMLYIVGRNWNDLSPELKNGSFITTFDQFHPTPKYEEISKIINPIIPPTI